MEFTKRKVGIISTIIAGILFFVIYNIPYEALKSFNSIMNVIMIGSIVAEVLLILPSYKKKSYREFANTIILISIAYTFVLKEASDKRLLYVAPVVTASCFFTIEIEPSPVSYDDKRLIGIFYRNNDRSQRVLYKTDGKRYGMSQQYENKTDSLFNRLDIDFQLGHDIPFELTVDMLLDKSKTCFVLNTFASLSYPIKIKRGYCSFLINGNVVETIIIPEQMIDRNVVVYSDLEHKPETTFN